MKKVNIWLTEDQLYMLDCIVQSSRFRRSELIRQAIDAWFEEKEKHNEDDTQLRRNKLRRI